MLKECADNPQKLNTNGQKIYGKMSGTSHLRNANQNCIEIPFYHNQNSTHYKNK